MAVALLLLASVTGCSTLRENRPLCMAVAMGTGAALGGTAGGLIVSEAANHGREGDGSYNWEVAGGAAGGTALGALIGWGIAQAVCEEPAPPPAPVKSPPPPPVTQKRGG